MAISHNLPQDEALIRVKGMLEAMKKEAGDDLDIIEESWKDNVGTSTFKAKGMKFSGTMTVTDKALEIQGTIPLLAVLFRGIVEKEIRRRAEELLDPNTKLV